MDKRSIVKAGKSEIVRQPCVVECAGCVSQFEPSSPTKDGEKFCQICVTPAKVWAANSCPFYCLPETKKKKKTKKVKVIDIERS